MQGEPTIIDPEASQAFLSYAHTDDDYLDGAISWLRTELEEAMQAVSGNSFPIFQDKDGIAFGQHWPDRLEEALKNARFLIPILTPSYFTSEYCRAEAKAFLHYETKAGNRDRILPIYLFEAKVLEDQAQRAADELATCLHSRQYGDWRADAFKIGKSDEIKEKVAELARQIDQAIRRATIVSPGIPPDNRAPEPPEEAAAGARPVLESTDISRRVQELPDTVDVAGTIKPRTVWPFLLPIAALIAVGSAVVASRMGLIPSTGGGEATDSGDLETPVAARFQPERAAADAKLAAAASSVREPGAAFLECLDCPEMIIIPSGAFVMGSEAGKGAPDEQPAHEVTISHDFAIGRYEVTFAQWQACVDAGGCSYQPNDDGQGDGDPDTLAELPVINVSWEDAQTYVRWLSKKTGQIYRLPTEAEWEYVARAGTETLYYWGDDKDGCKFANALDRRGFQVIGGSAQAVMPCFDGYAQTAPGGTFKANAFRVHDMLGNVSEWVEDHMNGDYVGAPVDGSERLSGDKHNHRVLRGGDWKKPPDSIRTANRLHSHWNSRESTNGFRVVRELSD